MRYKSNMINRWDEYLDKLGFLKYTYLNEDHEIEDVLNVLNPNLKNKKIVSKIRKIAQTGDNNKYNLINASFERSIIVSLYFYNIRYKAQTKYFDSEYVGEKILDIGCMNGIMTCYLAYIYPDKTITGIDCDAKSIEYAIKIANILNLTNINFLCGDCFKMNYNYDTIIYSYSLHELLCKPEYKKYCSFQEKLNSYKKIFTKPITFIGDNTKNVLIFSSRINALASLGMLDSFSDIGLNCFIMKNDNVGYDDYMQFYAFSKCNNKAKKRPVEIWRDFYLEDTDDNPELFDEDAEERFYVDSKEIIYGFITFKGSKITSRAMISQSISDETAIYVYLEDEDGIVCQCYDKSMYTEAAVMLSEKKNNLRFEEIHEL